MRSGPGRLLLVASVVLSLICDCTAQTSAITQVDPAAADIASGIRLFQNREPAAAKLKFSAGVKANPQSADALTWRGITENQLKEYAAAVLDFNAALRIDPNDLPAHYNLALSLIRTGRSGDAIEQLRTVVKAHPGVVEPEYNLAILLERRKVTAEAIEHLQAAYQTQPSDMGVAQHLLLNLLVLGRTEEAQPILEQVQAAGSPQAKLQIGTALLEAGQFQQAIVLLESAQAQQQVGREVDGLLARAYIGAQEDFKAVSLLKPAEASDTSGETAYLLGMAYSGTGAIEEAKDAYERAIHKNPQNGRAFYRLGLIESTMPEQQANASLHLRKALLLDPGNAAYGIALGRVLLQQDNAHDALILLQRVKANGPEAAERDLLLGIAQLSESSPSRALPTLMRAVTENPSLALSHNMLGFCYFEQGDYATASRFYRQASDLSPETLVFAHSAAVALERSGDDAQAMIYATRAVALPAAGGEDHYLVGKLLAKAGKKEDALRELNEAIALNPDLDKTYYLLARTYMQMGDVAHATEWNAKLTELKQRHERAYAATKNAKPVSSSKLLQGSPVAGVEAEAP